MIPIDIALAWFAFIPAFLFTSCYAALARWWRTQEGQNVLLLGFLLTLLAIRTLVIRYDDIPDAHWSWYLRVIVLGIGLVLWWRFVLLLRAQYAARASTRLPRPRSVAAQGGVDAHSTRRSSDDLQA